MYAVSVRCRFRQKTGRRRCLQTFSLTVTMSDMRSTVIFRNEYIKTHRYISRQPEAGGIFIESNAKITARKIELYKKLRINKPVAKALICLSEDKEITSSIIEREAGLKQPEVSTAVKYLLANNWISVTEVKGKKAGRPVKYYKLIKSRDEIFDAIEGKVMENTNEMLKTLEELRKLS